VLGVVLSCVSLANIHFFKKLASTVSSWLTIRRFHAFSNCKPVTICFSLVFSVLEGSTSFLFGISTLCVWTVHLIAIMVYQSKSYNSLIISLYQDF
jgi:hypothetical protein